MISVLVVDDDKSVLRTFARILEREGFAVDVVETGGEAIDKMGERKYDVALIDFRLPDMDGTQLILKLNGANKKMLKIMITGFPSIDFGASALERGADAYLVKPVNPQDLLSLIKIKLNKTESS